MKAAELRQKYINFFIKKGHKLIPSASLIPENDPSALFISAGMHPLVPYLLGEPHPLGKRLCSVQKCLRTVDIENVGDGFHHTFFEMLGNWSLGDYWKEEAVSWSYEFLTEHLNIDPKKISVSCFAGDEDAPKDEESALIWQKLGIPQERIYFLSKKDNWWGPAGKTGPCGPDSEMFFDTGKPKCSPKCDVSCQCGKYIEIWNDVFMQYNKTEEGKFIPLNQKNVDTGMGVDRVTAVTSSFGEDDYKNDLFVPIIEKIEQVSEKKYGEKINKRPMRIIADHLRAASFVIADGIAPSNVDQGYVLRRLIRRSIRHGRTLQLSELFTAKVAESVIASMGDVYPELLSKKRVIYDELDKEEEKFLQTLGRGIKEFEKLIAKGQKLSGKDAFFLYETYGFPFELTMEMAKEKGLFVGEAEFKEAFEEHQQKSRVGAEKKFAGGLVDHSEQVVKYHTATHLLHLALREVLGEHVHQVGSNLTVERLRFDFTHPEKLTGEEIREVQNLVNQKIRENLPVTMEVMSLEEARKAGALAFFEQKYTEKVKVYTVGGFSKEVCGGPHVKNTGEIGKIEIYKEEAVGSGKRRIYARIAGLDG
jgi:alanyl-tRNA synthetase